MGSFLLALTILLMVHIDFLVTGTGLLFKYADYFAIVDTLMKT